MEQNGTNNRERLVVKVSLLSRLYQGFTDRTGLNGPMNLYEVNLGASAQAESLQAEMQLVLTVELVPEFVTAFLGAQIDSASFLNQYRDTPMKLSYESSQQPETTEGDITVSAGAGAVAGAVGGAGADPSAGPWTVARLYYPGFDVTLPAELGELCDHVTRAQQQSDASGSCGRPVTHTLAGPSSTQQPPLHRADGGDEGLSSTDTERLLPVEKEPGFIEKKIQAVKTTLGFGKKSPATTLPPQPQLQSQLQVPVPVPAPVPAQLHPPLDSSAATSHPPLQPLISASVAPLPLTQQLAEAAEAEQQRLATTTTTTYSQSEEAKLQAEALLQEERKRRSDEAAAAEARLRLQEVGDVSSSSSAPLAPSAPHSSLSLDSEDTKISDAAARRSLSQSGLDDITDAPIDQQRPISSPVIDDVEGTTRKGKKKKRTGCFAFFCPKKPDSEDKKPLLKGDAKTSEVPIIWDILKPLTEEDIRKYGKKAPNKKQRAKN